MSANVKQQIVIHIRFKGGCQRAAKPTSENMFSDVGQIFKDNFNCSALMELKIELDTYHDDYYRFPGCFFDFVIFSMFLALILTVFFNNVTKDFQKYPQNPKNLNLVM